MKNYFEKLSSFMLLTCVATTAFAQHTKYIEAVDEYVPAPGQFVGELPLYETGNTAADMAKKCTDCIAANHRDIVTLGGYGGYITFHFDHPVVNLPGQKDFAVWGNAFYDNSEPAIVMVSVDENHNGLPDDTFYELRGSEYDNSVHNYSITYTYASMQDTKWTDNQGGSGVIPRNEYHQQEYFPMWLADAGSLTFTGTLLPSNAMLLGKIYILSGYDYGYADNWPNNKVDDCSMNIDWAIDAEGQPVSLDHIDFVRCYTGVNQVCGDIGETSSEITGAEDLHLEESLLTAVGSMPANSGQDAAAVYDISGRRLNAESWGRADDSARGFIIVRRADGSVRKYFRK